MGEVNPKSWTKNLIKLRVNEFCTVQDSFRLVYEKFSRCCYLWWREFLLVLVLYDLTRFALFRKDLERLSSAFYWTFWAGARNIN